MELQQLKTFATIAKTQSFTKASEILDYAQSSLSAQIRLLEDELDTKLFERMGRKVFLTKEGEKFLGYAEKILALAKEAKEAVSGSDTPKGTLVIGAPESICVYRLPVILQEYKRLYPAVEIILKIGTCPELFGWIRNNTIDIAILMDTRITPEDLVIEALREEPMVLIAGEIHALAKKEKTKPQHLENQQLIMIEKDCCYRSQFETQLETAKIQPASTLEVGSIETIKKCVISGLGLSLLPKMTVEQELTTGSLKDLHWEDSDFNIVTLMVYHKDKWLSPAMKVFIELTKRQLKEN